MSDQLPPMPPERPKPPEQTPELRRLPGADPSRGIARRGRIPRSTVVALAVIGVLIVIGAINGSSGGGSAQSPSPNTNMITSSDCTAQGGHIVGNTCYLP